MKRTYLAALLVAGLFIAWMLSGLLGGEENVGPAPALSETRDALLRQRDDTPTPVRARVIHAEAQFATVVVRGRTEANRRVAVKAETGGLITELPIEKGDHVAAGDIICRIDPGSRPARLDESREAAAVAELEYAGALRLEERGLMSPTAVATARARVASTRAEVRQRELDLAHTAIRAPFAGVIETRPVELGDFLQFGETCAEVLDVDPMLLVGQVAEREVARLEVGRPGHGRLLTGQDVSGQVAFVGRSAHPETRTFRVEVAVPNPGAELREGITTELRLPAEEHRSHHIPASVLALDDTGELGVRILDDDNVVVFSRIRIIRDSADGLWVTGLPETVTLITVGQELVIPGERVQPVFEGDVRLPAAASGSQ